MKSNAEYIAEFEEDVRMRGWSEWPIKSCRYTLNMFFDIVDKNCVEVDIEDLKKYYSKVKDRDGQLGKKQLSPETIRKHFNNLASFFEFLEFEDHIVKSPIPKFRRRYLGSILRKSNGTSRRQIITVEQMSTMVNIILDPQEKAILCTLAKTGVRVTELISMDVDDIDWIRYSIKLKPTGKRHDQSIYFDNETAKCLKRWLDVREEFARKGEKALFLNPSSGKRTTQAIANNVVKKHAMKLGLHDDTSSDLSKRFTPHCCRHWFTTHLRRAGMPREYIMELRGDARSDTMDIYDHIDEEELRAAYMECVPKLGI